MSFREIKFGTITNFTGRNGFMKCGGVEVMENHDKTQIILSPLTSRGQVGRCDIFIPVEDAAKVAEALLFYADAKHDKHGFVIKVGDSVSVPVLDETDMYSHNFMGTVDGFHGDYVTVRDQDDDCFDVEPERLEIVRG